MATEPDGNCPDEESKGLLTVLESLGRERQRTCESTHDGLWKLFHAGLSMKSHTNTRSERSQVSLPNEAPNLDGCTIPG